MLQIVCYNINTKGEFKMNIEFRNPTQNEINIEQVVDKAHTETE